MHNTPDVELILMTLCEALRQQALPLLQEGRPALHVAQQHLVGNNGGPRPSQQRKLQCVPDLCIITQQTSNSEALI